MPPGCRAHGENPCPPRRAGFKPRNRHRRLRTREESLAALHAVRQRQQSIPIDAQDQSQTDNPTATCRKRKFPRNTAARACISTRPGKPTPFEDFEPCRRGGLPSGTLSHIARPCQAPVKENGLTPPLGTSMSNRAKRLEKQTDWIPPKSPQGPPLGKTGGKPRNQARIQSTGFSVDLETVCLSSVQSAKSVDRSIYL